jgi:hypothetical protein
MKFFRVLALIVLLAPFALSQNVRFSTSFPSVSSSTAIPYLIANTPPNSPVLAVCNSPANQVPCTNYATTFTSTGAACPNGAQNTPDPQPSACQSMGDAQGNIGFWAPAGKYDYTVCIQNSASCFGPYTVTIGGSGGGGGASPAGVNQINASNNTGSAFQGIANVAAGSVLASTSPTTLPAPQVKPIYDVRDHGFVDDNSTDNIANVRALVTAIGSTPATIQFPVASSGIYKMSFGRFPANVTLDFSAGGAMGSIVNTTPPGNGVLVNKTGAECNSSQVTCTTANATNGSTTLALITGNTAVALIEIYPSWSLSTTDVRDNCGNVYHEVQQSTPGQPRNSSAWVASSVIGGTCTLTETANGTMQNAQVLIRQYSGLGPVVGVDGIGATSNAPQNPMSSGTGTFLAHDLLIGYGGSWDTSQTCSAGAGYGNNQQTASGFLCAEDILNGSAGVLSATQNISTVPENLVYNLIGLRPVSTTIYVAGAIVDPDFHQICYNCTGTNGTLSLANNAVINRVYPEWVGGSAAASDNSGAINAAVAYAFNNNGAQYNKTLDLSHGIYHVTSETQWYNVNGNQGSRFVVDCGSAGGIQQDGANLRLIDAESMSYGRFDNCTFIEGGGSTGPMLDIDWDSVTTPHGTTIQFLDFYGVTFGGGNNTAVGLQLAKSGGNAQGSNVYCHDCEGIGFSTAVWQVGTAAHLAQNALAIGWAGGDMQDCPAGGFADYGGGYIDINGTTFECSNAAANLATTQTGADFQCYNAQGLCTMENVRAEDRLLCWGCTSITNSNGTTAAWYPTPGTSLPVGWMVEGSNVAGDGVLYQVTVDGGSGAPFSGIGKPGHELIASSGSATSITDTYEDVSGSVAYNIFVPTEVLTQTSSGATSTLVGTVASHYTIAGALSGSTLFQYGETVTQASTGSHGPAGSGIGTNNMNLATLTGAPDASHNWVGGTSGAIYVPSAAPVAEATTMLTTAISGSPDGTHAWVGGTSSAVFTPTASPVADANWTTNSFNGMRVAIDSGTSNGCYGIVTSNSATVINFSAGLTTYFSHVACPSPDSTSAFLVEPGWNGGTVTSGGMTLVAVNDDAIKGSGTIENVTVDGELVNWTPLPGSTIKGLLVTRSDWLDTSTNGYVQANTPLDWDVSLVQRVGIGGNRYYRNWNYDPTGSGGPYAGGAKSYVGPFQRNLGTYPLVWSCRAAGGSFCTDVFIGARSTPAIDDFHLEFGGILESATPFGTDQNATNSQFGCGRGTGAGTPGVCQWLVSAAGSSGSTPQTEAAGMTLGPSGLTLASGLSITLTGAGAGSYVKADGSGYGTPGGGGGTWAGLTGDLTETQVIPFDGPTVGTADSGISRLAPVSLAVGNGTTGSYSGTFTATQFCLTPSSCITAWPVGSGGTVSGPGSSTVNNIVLWNNTTGTLVSDAGFGFPLDKSHVGTLAAGSNGLGTFATQNYAAPPAIGGSTPAAGAFTTLAASSTVSGPGFSTYLASPPAIGGTTPAAGAFTTLKATTNATTTNCAAAGSAANPSVVACSAAPAGQFACHPDASTGTCQVNTTAVLGTADEIFIQPSSAATIAGVTCNTTADTELTLVRLASQAAGYFVANLGTYNTNYQCFNYWVVN